MSSSAAGLPDMTGSIYKTTQVRGRQGGWEAGGCAVLTVVWPSPLSLYPADF